MPCVQNPSQLITKCYLILIVINLYGKINYVIAESELTGDCSEFDSGEPIVIVGNERLQPINKNTYEINNEVGFLVKCKSKSPVKLRYSGFLPSPPESTLTRITPINGTSSFCHEVSVKVHSTKAATGSYRCENQLTGLNKSAFIFVNGNVPPYLVYAGREIPGRVEDDQIVLPCISTNSSAEIRLFKENVEISKSRVNYDQTKGFWFKKSLFDNPEGNYKCLTTTSGHEKDFVQVIVKIPKPQSTNGNGKITFEANNEELLCKNAKYMTLVPCNTPLDCDFVRSCGQRFLESSDNCIDINVQIKQTNERPKYRNGERIYNEPIVKSPKGSGGLVFCSNEDPDVIEEFSYFTDVNGSTIQNFKESTWSIEKNTYMISAPTIWSWEDNFYTEEFLSLSCNVSKLLFGDIIEWEFRFNNGSIIKPEIFNETVSNEKNYYSKKSTLKISDANISDILCKARSIDSAEWNKISHPVKVLLSQPVKMKNSQNETVYFELTNPDPRISCTASGLPQPAFTWYKDGEEEMFNTNHDHDNNTNSITSKISLRLVSSEKSVVYTCNATNIRNTVLKHFKVLTNIPGNSGDVWIIIVAVATIFLILILAAGAIFYFRFKKSHEEFSKEDQNAFFEGDEEGETNDAYSSNSEPMYQNLPYCKDTEIPDADKNLIIESELGRGNFGIVSKGRLNINGIEQIVAVKSIKPCTPLETFKDFLSELKILQYVGEHENVVRLIGSVTKDIAKRKVLIVVEYCKYNDLREYLISHKSSFQNELQEAPTVILNSYCAPPTCQAETSYSKVDNAIRTSTLIQWSYEIASGMEYLSSKKLIHRDLAARNILLTEQLVAKITDFGLSKNVYKDAKTYYIPSPDKTCQVPWRWFSIEAMSDMKFSVDSDIWAFGIVMYEIFTLGEVPYEEVPDHFIHLFLKENRRLAKPRYANQAIYKIMLSCWNKEGSQRPRFSQLMEEIDTVRDSITQPDTYSTTDTGSSYYEELGHFDSDNDLGSQLSQSQEEENVV